MDTCDDEMQVVVKRGVKQSHHIEVFFEAKCLS